MSESKLRHRAERRRLRLEILETRCLLTAAPLLLVTPDVLPLKLPDPRELFDARDGGAHEIGSPRNGHHRQAESVDRNGADNRDFHSPRPGRQEHVPQRPRPEQVRLAPFQNGLQPLPPPPPLNTTAEQRVQHNNLVQATDLALTHDAIESVVAEQGPKTDQVLKASREIELIIIPITQPKIFVIISEELAGDVAQHRNNYLGQIQAASINPSDRTHVRVQTDPTAGTRLQSNDLAPPSRKNFDFGIFEFDSPDIPVNPQQLFEAPSTLPSADAMRQGSSDLADDPSRSLDFALKSLFPDLDRLDTLQELDRLLESLAEERGGDSQFSLGRFNLDPLSADRSFADESFFDDETANPAMLQDGLPESGNSPAARWRNSPSDPSRTIPSDGMIALQLPGDLLIANSEFLDQDLRDQTAAWTARIGFYRAHELASAGAGTASMRGPTNLQSAMDLAQHEHVGDSIVASRLRPIVAATSVAFGAIFIRFRQRRRSGMKIVADRGQALVQANEKAES